MSLWVRGQGEKTLLGVCRSCPHQILPQFSSVTPWRCSPAPGRPWDPSTSGQIPIWGTRGKGGIVKQARPRAAKQRQRQRAEQSRLGAGVTARRSWSTGSKLVPAGPSCSECLRASPARPRCLGKMSSLHGLTTFSEDCTAASAAAAWQGGVFQAQDARRATPSFSRPRSSSPRSVPKPQILFLWLFLLS